MITPAFQTFDLAVHKQFAMPYNEGHSLQFRLEAFNVFNHPVWAAPNGNHPGGCDISGSARQCRASGLRRHQLNGHPDAPASSGTEVFVLGWWCHKPANRELERSPTWRKSCDDSEVVVKSPRNKPFRARCVGWRPWC